MLRRFCWTLGAVGVCLTHAAQAQEVRITRNMASVSVTVNGQAYNIGRIQDTQNRLTGDAALTSRACPPACITPMIAAPGVATVGELELISFLSGQVGQGTGLLIDVRDPADFATGTVPGAVNVPLPTLDADNPYRPDILIALRATAPATGGALDFSGAFHLMILGAGPYDDSGGQAVRNLIEAGYPADKLSMYRGGLQGWRMLGLTTAPAAPGG
jgi:rhodanese-related sulfurtransferase